MPALLVSKKKNNILYYCIIAFCISVLLYVQTLSFGFTNFDDHLLISQNIAFLSHVKNLLHAFQTDAFIVHTSPFYRPLQSVSYMADVLLSAVNQYMDISPVEYIAGRHNFSIAFPVADKVCHRAEVGFVSCAYLLHTPSFHIINSMDTFQGRFVATCILFISIPVFFRILENEKVSLYNFKLACIYICIVLQRNGCFSPCSFHYLLFYLFP